MPSRRPGREGRGAESAKLVGLLADRRLILALATLAAVIIAVAGYKIRMLPYNNYLHVANLATHYGISQEYARYAFLNANDPWIEYWLAKYLHDHGLFSWSTLTRDNPATHIFWYPWGRDFTRSEYPLVPMMGSLGRDPLVSTVKLPAVAGAVMVLVAYAFAAMEYGPLAGVLAALLAAFLPAATSRTFAGFVEKTGIAMPFLIAALWMYARAVRSGKLAYAVASAVFWVLVALTWGGYGLMNIAVALTVLLAPLSLGVRSEKTRRVLDLSLISLTIFTVTTIVLEKLGYGITSLLFIEATYAVVAFVYAFVFYVEGRLGLPMPRRYETKPERLYLYTVIALLVLAPILAVAAGLVRGKYAYTLFWPLRDLGVLKTGRIEETVAEMSGVIGRGTFREFFTQTNVVGAFAPLAALYLLYRALRRGEAEHLPLATLSLLLFYSVLGMLYLLQAFASISLLAVAAAAGLLVVSAFGGAGDSGRKRRRSIASSGVEDLARIVAVLFTLIIIIGSAFAAAASARTLSAVGATVTGGTVGRAYLGWLWTLQYLGENVSKDVVVAAWWDYGYWISVGSGHPSLADGATMNGTQIRLLAEAFSGTEEDANKVFYMLKLEPGKTLVLFNDYLVYNPETGRAIYFFPFGGIDLRKAWAMHHIAGRDKKFNDLLNTVLYLVQQGGDQKAAQHLRTLVNNTLIFKMVVDAAYNISSYGVVVPQAFKGAYGGMRVSGVYIGAIKDVTKIPFMPMKHFEPYMVVLAPFIDNKGNIIVTRDGIVAHVIVIYRWVG